MATPAYGAILLSVGFALLAPRLLKGVLDRLPLTGASGWLAVRNLRHRADHLSGILMSLILFTAVSVATLYMQGVESDAVAASGAVKSVDAKNLETLNLTVVGIIVVFVCVTGQLLYAAQAPGVRAQRPRATPGGPGRWAGGAAHPNGRRTVLRPGGGAGRDRPVHRGPRRFGPAPPGSPASGRRTGAVAAAATPRDGPCGRGPHGPLRAPALAAAGSAVVRSSAECGAGRAAVIGPRDRTR